MHLNWVLVASKMLNVASKMLNVASKMLNVASKDFVIIDIKV